MVDELAKLGWEISIALLDGGELEAEYKARDPKLRILSFSRQMGRPGLAAALRVLGRPALAKTIDDRRRRHIQVKAGGVNAVLVNSAPSLVAVAPRRRGGPPVVVLVHELDYAWQLLLSSAEQERLLREPSAYITSSQAVKQYLIDRGVPAEKVSVIRLPKAISELRPPPAVPRTRPGRVLSVGTLEWRKGADLFIQAAIRCERAHPGEVEWVWLGNGTAPNEDQFRRDVGQAALAGVLIRHEPGVSDPTAWYDSADVLALTSREDPYPLVVLEAAARQRPVVCFADSGGAPEFVGRGAGSVVPALDVTAFAEAAWLRTHDGELAAREGQRGAQLVSDEHQPDAAAAAINEVLARVLGERD